MPDHASPATTEWADRCEFDSISRHASGFGVGRMIVLHPVEGAIHVDLTRDELRSLAMQALAAMEPPDTDENGRKDTP